MSPWKSGLDQRSRQFGALIGIASRLRRRPHDAVAAAFRTILDRCKLDRKVNGLVAKNINRDAAMLILVADDAVIEPPVAAAPRHEINRHTKLSAEHIVLVTQLGIRNLMSVPVGVETRLIGDVVGDGRGRSIELFDELPSGGNGKLVELVDQL